MSQSIRITGAKTHNLKNLSLEIPKNQLVVITGLSGSGKSSLAFHTIYSEGQRRYVESLSSYARQFLSMMEKPEVDRIEGLSPAIAIEQKTASHNPRSTVGTITEIYDYLRLLFARIGIPHCPTHHQPLNPLSLDAMVDKVFTLPEQSRIMILAPIVQERKGEYLKQLDQLKKKGFVRVKINDHIVHLDDPFPKLAPQVKHNISVVIDRLKVRPEVRTRLSESLTTALELADGLVDIACMDHAQTQWRFSSKHACSICHFSAPPLDPKLFSFNSPSGACKKCNGLGFLRTFDPDKIITNPSLALADGAIRGWDRRHHYAFQTMEALAAHFDFSLETPYQTLDPEIQHMLLYGSKRAIEFSYTTHAGRARRSKKRFEGFLSIMERRYQQTESEAVRQNYAQYLSDQSCPECEGSRLNPTARHVKIKDKAIVDWIDMPIDELHHYCTHLSLEGNDADIASIILHEIENRLTFLLSVGLNYLSLNRTAETLSGGEAQRIRLASQIGSGLTGVLYVLDEPTIGLHHRDNARLLQALHRLRDLGNSVLIVEHDEETIIEADYLIDIGPGAGAYGGNIVAMGTPKEVMDHPHSLTGAYLSGKESIPIPKKRATFKAKQCIHLEGAEANNLKAIDLKLSVGLMTCITGVSGSGKSSLIKGTLEPLVCQHLGLKTKIKPGKHRAISGLEYFDKMVVIDQSPIGRTPRSNPATYTGMLTTIRELFTQTEEARARGYNPGRFSFNMAGGRCEACQGGGMIRVEMHFLADMYITCETCEGKRYNRDTLDIRYKGKSIDQILTMSVLEALDFFEAIPSVHQKCQTMIDVGLGYIRLGQSATTLSGGEAQRLKLSKELSKRATGQTLYILDEPTTGLHMHDVKQLMQVLIRLRDMGNTLIVIEHNLDVIKTADWIIDLGPEGGKHGGTLLAADTPENIAQCKHSYTGKALKHLLNPDAP